MNPKPQVLFVDDDEQVLSCFERLMGKRFIVVTALGPLRAVEALTEHGPFAVVVTDMRMPGMSGLDLLRKVKALSPETVGIVLTGNADLDGEGEVTQNSVAFRIVSKPCPTPILIEIIDEGLRQNLENTSAPVC